MQLLIASSNLGKIQEVQAQFKGINLQCLSPQEFSRPIPDVVEDGETYFENALKKAFGFYRAYGTSVLSDDSGLEVEALGGAPGVLSARYGGKDLSWPERWKRLHSDLKGVPQPWKARFVCILCYFDGQGVPRFYEGLCQGKILSSAHGDKGFGYDPVFWSDELQKPFGEASTSEKQRVSHRGKALQKLAEDLFP